MFLRRYMRWLHTQWPAGTVEKLPDVNADGSTHVPGLYVVGDLTGIPLLKFSADSGARAVQTIIADPAFQKLRAEANGEALDLVIVGGGVSGMAAALEAHKQSLKFEILEGSEPFSTIVNFPKGKPIYTYPTEMTPAGDLQFTATIKEPLVDEIRAQTLGRGIKPRIARSERITRKGKYLEVVLAPGTGKMPRGTAFQAVNRPAAFQAAADVPSTSPTPTTTQAEHSLLARRVIVAIGRSGNFRKLGVPGEDLDKVYNRLHDPKEFVDKEVLVVGGGDSAVETAIAIAQCGGHVTLSCRGKEFSRPKPENVEKITALMADPMADVAIEHPTSERVSTSSGGFMGEYRRPAHIHLMMGSRLKSIAANEAVVTDADGNDVALKNDVVFAMIGREAPLEFFCKSGVRIRGEYGVAGYLAMAAFVLFCFWLYHWKGEKSVPLIGHLPAWLDPNPSELWSWARSSSGRLASWVNDPATLLGTIAKSSSSRSFWYTLAYSTIVVVFGFRRIHRRRTPYVKLQTLTLMAIQVLPLFILPEILLPWLGANGAFDSGFGFWIKEHFFPGESWWRAYGLILAWPLFVFNWFTDQPLWGWLIIGVLQTCVLIPGLIYFYGKGAYCGWICSCGALAETLGDTHRHKMPHGPRWNRLNMIGQAILWTAVTLMLLRVVGWSLGPDSWASRAFRVATFHGDANHSGLSYQWLVDLLAAGIIGYGLYFWFSGRVWCRFACPLAALMHIYARFSRFRILADKKKCISCNVCTSVCHQGIDIMNFANKGLPMDDPECVRCSACVQSCPTGVLEFGQIDRRTGDVIKRDGIIASLVVLHEKKRAPFMAAQMAVGHGRNA